MAEESRQVPVALTIAGSDSGGGAGIQADLKAFARCGVHGASAITALTAQSTVGVESAMAVPPEMIIAQVRAVVEDIGIDAVKTGMLGDERTIEAVAEALELTAGVPLVVDPVMVAESGAVLLDPEAKDALVERILPRATVATPNLPEARRLAGLDEEAGAEELARAVHDLGPRVVVVTAGHGDGGADTFFDGQSVERIEGPVHPEGSSHGSGCTHASAMAAFLARGEEPLEAARRARRLAAEAVGQGLRGLGAGAGPVDVLGISGRP